MGDVQSLYQKVILQHNKEPHHYGELAEPTVTVSEENPVCGDRVQLMLRINSSHIVEDIRFTGRGCAISIASASMMTDLVQSKSLPELQTLLQQMYDIFRHKLPPNLLSQFGDYTALQGVFRFPVRIKCVLLPWHALEKAIDLFQQNR